MDNQANIHDCIVINPEHQGEAARLLTLAVLIIEREDPELLSPSLRNWRDHMKLIEEWKARQKIDSTHPKD